jgi:hypothetical protein
MRCALLLGVVACAAAVQPASADPAFPRVITAPTAWLPPAGATVVTAGSDHHGAGMGDAMIGLGGLASVDIGVDTDVRGCTVCEGDESDAKGLWLGRAGFRLGARQDGAFSGAPALILGMRTTFAARGHLFGAARVTDAYLVASRTLAAVRLHAGAQLTEAAFDDRTVRMAPTLRPFGGLEWTPAAYPRTTLIADVAWLPELRTNRTISQEWTAGWGVRYQALRWGSIELAVRHREDEGLGDTTVMVRLNAIALPKNHKAVLKKPR